jgi:hydrogenase nickel incorporation protein HypB
MDMADAAEFDLAAACRNIDSVSPGMKIFEVSSKTGLGMEEIFNFLDAQLAHFRIPASFAPHVVAAATEQ